MVIHPKSDKICGLCDIFHLLLKLGVQLRVSLQDDEQPSVVGEDGDEDGDEGDEEHQPNTVEIIEHFRVCPPLKS